MLKKTLLACIFLLSIISVSGQSFSKSLKQQDQGLISLTMNPSIYVIVDSVSYEIDSKKVDDIKNSWIEKTIIMKDETTKKISGNKNGVVYIYTLKKYKKEVLKEIEKSSTQ